MKNELKKLNYKNFIMLTIAGFINAFGITVFLMPVSHGSSPTCFR